MTSASLAHRPACMEHCPPGRCPVRTGRAGRTGRSTFVLLKASACSGATALCIAVLPLSALAEDDSRAPVILPDYAGHLGIDIQAPGGKLTQEDAPVIWNGPRATVIFLGSVSKVPEHAPDEDGAHGDGYGTMLVKLKVDVSEPMEFPTEVRMSDILDEITGGDFGSRAPARDAMHGLRALRESSSLRAELRPLLRRYRNAKRLDRREIERDIAGLLGIRLTVSTDSIVVIAGHLRPSKAFIRHPDPEVRFSEGMKRGDIVYRWGSVIEPGTILGFMERDHYEGSSTAPHVHIGAYAPDLLRDDAWGYRGRGVDALSAIREAFLDAETAVRTLALLRNRGADSVFTR